MRYEFHSYNQAVGARIQGCLDAVVIGPAGREDDARQLAIEIANGSTRAAARSYCRHNGGNPDGLRVIRAALCQ